MAKKRTWTLPQLRRAVKSAVSRGQVLKLLKLKPAGGNYAQIKKYIEEHKLNTSHFLKHAWNKGLTGIGKPRIPLKEILVKNRFFQSYKLQKRLITLKLKPGYCERCHWAEKTIDGFLPLELDHINGDHYDNRIENLRILCPNCHSLTPHHRGRGKKKYL